MDKILITGSNGFIGNYFLKHYDVKYDINTFSFLKDDFQALNLEGVNSVIHLSALVHQMGGASKEEYEKINVVQTLDLAKKAKKSGVKHFIFMSTVKVYGEETDTPYDENTKCVPQDDYGKSKLKAEIGLQKLEDDTFKVSIIRTPIVYGMGVKANIKNLVNLVKRVPVLPFADINNKRSMIFIGNLCYIIDEIIKQKKSGVFLASDDEPISTSKLIDLIAQNLDKKTYLIKIPFFAMLLKLFKPSFYQRLYGSLELDNTATRKELDLRSPYTTVKGLRSMIRGEE